MKWRGVGMAKKISKIVRVDPKTYEVIKKIKCNMEHDAERYTGKKCKVPIGRVIKLAVVDNENFIKVPLEKLPNRIRGYKRK